MPIRLLSLWILLIALLGMGLVYTNPVSAGELAVGDNAPLITGKIAVGKGLLKLRSLMKEIGYQKNANGQFKKVNGKFVLEVKNNIVVLNFFSTTCIPCLREIPAYNRVAAHFSRDDVKLIYVNVEPDVTRQKIRRFIARKQIQVPMMLPNQREVIKKYHVVSLPRIIIIDRKGKVNTIIDGFKDQLETYLVAQVRKLLPNL